MIELLFFFAMSWHMPDENTMVERWCVQDQAIIQDARLRGSYTDGEMTYKFYWVNCYRV